MFFGCSGRTSTKHRGGSRLFGLSAAMFAVVFVAVFAGGNTFARAEADVGYVFFAEGVRLTVHFADKSVRLVFSDGEEVVLPRAVSASGARYTDGVTLFWNKGDEARLEWKGRTYETKLATPDNDVWERARAAGVSFRAVGSEPGWLVEIRDGENMYILLDYGTTALTTPLTEYRIHYGSGLRTYVSEPPGSVFHVVVLVGEGACYDGMSGEGFTSRVWLQLPDQELSYAGCGRYL